MSQSISVIDSSNSAAINALFDVSDESTPLTDAVIIPETKEKKEIKTTTEPTLQADAKSEPEEVVVPNIDDFFDTPEEKEKQEVASKEGAEKEVKKKTAESINFKSQVDYLVESGQWNDFEGREDISEVNEEEFSQLIKAQDEHRLGSKFSELLESKGRYAKAIIEFEENGGNPESLLELFREERDILNVDISDADGQEDLIRAYFNSQGEDDDFIDAQIQLLKDKGGDALKKEAEKRKARFLELNKQEREDLEKAQQDAKKQQIENQKQYEINMKKTIASNNELSNSEKKDLEKFVLGLDYKVGDRKVNGLFVKMLDIQKNPEQYIKLAQFVKDIDKYDEKIAKKTEIAVNKKTYSFLKTSQGDTKKSSILPDEEKVKSVSPFQYLTFK